MPFMEKVDIEWLPHGEGLELKQATDGSSGFDLCAAIDADIEVVLPPGSHYLVPCGFKLAIPIGWEAQVRARSGLALKQGIMMLNGIGTIDADYRGEVFAMLYKVPANTLNALEKDYTIPNVFKFRRGDRIAQLVFQRVPHVTLHKVKSLPETKRGVGGLGSTGVRDPNDTRTKCHYCGRLRGVVCMNTRDMDPIDGHNSDPVCNKTLSDLGGGERSFKFEKTWDLATLLDSIKAMGPMTEKQAEEQEKSYSKHVLLSLYPDMDEDTAVKISEMAMEKIKAETRRD